MRNVNNCAWEDLRCTRRPKILWNSAADGDLSPQETNALQTTYGLHVITAKGMHNGSQGLPFVWPPLRFRQVELGGSWFFGRVELYNKTARHFFLRSWRNDKKYGVANDSPIIFELFSISKPHAVPKVDRVTLPFKSPIMVAMGDSFISRLASNRIVISTASSAPSRKNRTSGWDFVFPKAPKCCLFGYSQSPNRPRPFEARNPMKNAWVFHI